MDEAPVRLCCMQRHWGAVCPDGLVMCQLCFVRFPIDQLNDIDGVKEDVCKECANEENLVFGGDDCFIGRMPIQSTTSDESESIDHGLFTLTHS